MMREGYYWLFNNTTKEATLVYFYNNPDTGENGFGFNIRDGGGFLPMDDVSDDTSIIYAGYELEERNHTEAITT